MRDTIKKDTVEPKNDRRGRRIKPKKPSEKAKDSLKNDTIKKPKNALEDIVKYKAKDSIVFNKVKNEIILLMVRYNKAILKRQLTKCTII